MNHVVAETMPSIAERLAERIVGVTYADIPDDARHWARVSILDTFGVALAGTAEPAIGIVERVTTAGSRGASTLLASGRRVSALDAALANGIATHVLDFDASSSVMVGHPSVHLLPALFALGEDRNLGGAALLTAYVVGFEVQARIARAVQPYHAEKGWFPGGTLGVFGTAAACAHLLGLSAVQATNALGVAANLAAGLMVNAGTMTKPLAAGTTARNGLMAALLAAEGFTASSRSLEDHRGFLTVFNGADHLDLGAILPGWGDPFDIVETAYNLKRHPCCGVLQSSVDVMADLVERHHLTPANVERIEAALITTRYGHVDRPNPRSNIDAKFSLQYCMARTLQHGRIRSQDFEGEAYDDAAVRTLMPLVHGRTHEETDPNGSRKEHGGVEVWVTTRDGQRHSARVAQPYGRVAGEPLPQDQLEAKFKDCAQTLVSPAVAEELCAMVSTIDTLDRVRRVTDLIHPA